MNISQKIEPLSKREMLIGSLFAYRTFLKKGYRVFRRLSINMNKSTYRLTLHEKRLKEVRLLKVFARIKSVKKLDLSQLLSNNRDVDFAVLLSIAKKMSAISCLSVYDPRGYHEWEFQEILTTWPRYLKCLRSLAYHLSVVSTDSKQSKESRFMMDYFKYLQRLEVCKITLPTEGDVHKIWKFKRYPTSLKKMSLHNANDTTTGELRIGVADVLKKLKAFEVKQRDQSSGKFSKSVRNTVLQLTQLQELRIAFSDYFCLSDVVCESMKKLTELKKVKFEISSKEYRHNLQILKSLEGCNLKNLNLRVTVKNEEEIRILSQLLRKMKNSLETVKIRLIKLELEESLERSGEFQELIENIDHLPRLTSLLFSIEPHKSLLGRAYGITEAKFVLNNIFCKTISLKKLRLSFNTFSISEKDFWAVFESLKQVALNLEKIEIDFWDCYLEDAQDGLDFLCSLENIRSLKFYGLFDTSEAFFLKLVDVVSGLKYLRTFWIGRISENIERSSLDEGLQRILSKPGLETFVCLSSGDFKANTRKYGENGVNVGEIMKKNSYFKKGQVGKISFLDNKDLWNDNVEGTR